jgi:NADP-dependent 3-hydroxy acid dehydrogenase YdfG
MDLKNRIAIVTGANKGIGLECVNQLLNAGAIVYGICRSGCQTSHPNYVCLKADVGKLDEVNKVMDEIFTKHQHVDILINNAGLGYFAFCDELAPEKWEEMFATNVNGIFYFTRRVLPGMKSTGSGHIVNIASTAGLEGYVQTSGYCATKFAVRGFSDALYKEVRDFGVKVTCVYPGSVKTDFFRHHDGIEPHDYMLKPEDIASQILYALASPPNMHHVNIEIRPLQPKGPRKS